MDWAGLHFDQHLTGAGIRYRQFNKGKHLSGIAIFLGIAELFGNWEFPYSSYPDY